MSAFAKLRRIPFPLAAAWFAGLAVAAFWKPLAWWVLLWSAGLSLVAFWLYVRDKKQARLADWRTPESTLLLADLLGGWPGGAVAQRLVRHKTSKRSYRLKHAAAVAINIAAVVGLIWWW